MLEAFKKFIADDKLPVHQTVLLAVSGGLDSVVMAELFYRSAYPFAIAHCNFNLRGEESDGDAAFVKNLAYHYHVPFHYKSFDTENHASLKGISTQMAARDLRYEWFLSLLEKEHFPVVATAHHKDDEIETVLINLTRGTGIAGLHGIQSRHGKIIRPLLFASRKEIAAFASDENLAYREDSSNSTIKYVRNKIRHQVIPVLKEINPNLESAFSRNIENIRNVEMIYNAAISEKRADLITERNGNVLIDIEKLKQLVPVAAYLFEFLSEYNFNSTVVNEIAASLSGFPGKQFFSPTHYLVKDREHLVITSIKKEEEAITAIDQQTSEIHYPLHLQFKVLPNERGFQIPASRHEAYLDYDLLTFPLIIRSWRPGDSFVPLGMKQSKKLSDFFIDHKVSRIDKKNAWVLVSDNNIVWLIGHRIHDRFKVGPHTSRLFTCCLLETAL